MKRRWDATLKIEKLQNLLRSGWFLRRPVHICAIENRANMNASKVVPCPLKESVQLRAHGCEQGGMDAELGSEGEDTRNGVMNRSDFRYRRVAANHRHDALVEISEGLLLFA